MPRTKNQGGALLESAVASGVLLGAAAAAASMSDAPAKFAARASRSMRMRGGMAPVMSQSGMASVVPGVINPVVQAQMAAPPPPFGPGPTMMKGGSGAVVEMAGGAKKRRVGRPCSPRAQKGGEYNAFVGAVDQALVDAQPPPVAPVTPVAAMHGGKTRKSKKAQKGGADLAEQYAQLVPNLNFMMSETHATAVPAMLAADPNAAPIQTGTVGMPAVMAGGRRRRGRPAKGKKGGSEEKQEEEKKEEKKEEEQEEKKEKEEDDQEGGRRRRRAPRRKGRKGGSEEKDAQEQEQEQEQQEEEKEKEDQEGGRRRAPRRKAKKGGAPDGVGLPATGAAPGVIESNLNFMMKGGKKAAKATKKEKSGGALDMYAEQLAALTQKLAALKAF